MSRLKTIATRWWLLGLGAVAVLAPGRPAGGEALGGIPLSIAGVFALAAVVFAALALPTLSFKTARWVAVGFVVAIALKLVAAVSAPPLGLTATYWANAEFRGAPERSTDARIDPALDLQGEDFAVHFFNDAARFNFGPDVQPGRDQLPFSMRWEGWLLAPSDGERRFALEANGPAQAWLDDAPLGAAANISAGLHKLRVDYARPEARVPRLRLSWQREPGGPLETVGGTDVRWQPTQTASGAASAIGLATDAVLLAALATWMLLALKNGVAVTRVAAGVLPLLFLLYGVLVELPMAGRATILSGLDDWLVYESSARDILLNGLLMDGGQGHAPPFYGQPLYPYALALAHRLTGEALFGPLVLQFAALGLVVVGTAVLARRAFGGVVDGLAAAACLLVLVQLEPEHLKIARQLFNENLYMPLVTASLIALVSMARRNAPPRSQLTLLVGILLGFTAITRSQFLLFVPFGLLILLLAWRSNWQQAGLGVGAIIVGLCVAIAPVTARNWFVSGQLVPISSGAGASMLEFHRPPPGLLDQAALQTDPLFQALHLDEQTRTVVAFARADPRGYVATLLPPLAHSLGLQGRADPGVYWPLLATVLVYLSSFAFTATRRLYVWPIHAFVATHLVVLMLFEADTYGYRLVMPMYAPMVAVAAQVALAAVRALTRSRAGAFMRSGDALRAARFAVVGWSAIALFALLWQGRTLIAVWPEREPSLHGLGGTAAHAALTADRVGASAIYVASIDGTPRRFGAGVLPGLRYPWFKWFDPVRTLPLAASSAVYMLGELGGHSLAGDLTACLGSADGNGELVVTAAGALSRCGTGLHSGEPVTFAGLARVEAFQVPSSAIAGEPLETRLLWTPLVAHPDPQQVSLQLDDGDGTLWGNGTFELYPANQWQPDEPLLSRLPVATDRTAAPDAYRLTLGIGPVRQNAAVERVPIATLTLTPGSSPAEAALPADMRPVDGRPSIGGGLELIGARPLPAEAAIGSRLRVGLLWLATQDEPSTAHVTMRLVRGSGEVVQEAVLPLLGGRVAPSALRSGNVVRDEQNFQISARAPTEALALELESQEAVVTLGQIKLTGRGHVFDAASTPEAVFGGSMQLLSDQVEPATARPGGRVTVRVRWRSGAAEIPQAYKVFVHVLDPDGQRVVAQRDAEPQDGRAPTTGWLSGEAIDDEYVIALPTGLAPGEYPIELGVYDPRSGDRLQLDGGDNRFVLATRLAIR